MLGRTPDPRSKFVERLCRLLERVQYRRVETAAELDAILRLRHAAFLREGQIVARPSGRFEDSFDQGDNLYNVAVFIDGELAGAVRLHVLSDPNQTSPALQVFGEFLRPELKAGKVILDSNRFVADQRLSRLHPCLPYVTIRLSYLASRHFAVDLATMTVRPEHRAFYFKNLFAKELCGPQPYPMLRKPICLLVTDLVRDSHRLLARHPYWASTEGEREAIFGPAPAFSRARTRTVAAA